MKKLKERILHMRKNALRMAFQCGSNAHLGGGLSLIEILAVLYGDIMNITNKSVLNENRDKFILSKGHGVLGLYAALAEFGVFSEDLLETFQQNGSDLIAHPVMNDALGLESSSGSLGQGISMAVGLALAAMKKGRDYKTYVVCGNGECNEGAVWEAVMSAVNFRLSNLTIIVDNNQLQSDGKSREVFNISTKYKDMFMALGCQVFDIDGHNLDDLHAAFLAAAEKGKPKVIIANTIKGKGISFMEGNNDWHHNRLTQAQYEEAMQELEAIND